MCYLLASFEVIGSRVFDGDYFMPTHVALLPKQICRNDRLGGKYNESCKLSMPLHDWSLACNAAIISHQYYANSIRYPSPRACEVHGGMPGSPVAVQAGASLLGPTTLISCLTALGALCVQLTFRLAWCREHSVVMVTSFAAACGTLFQASYVILTSPADCSDDSRRDTFFGSMNTVLCDFWYADMQHHRTLTYLLTPALLRTHSFVFFAVHETCRIFLSNFISVSSSLCVQFSQLNVWRLNTWKKWNSAQNYWPSVESSMSCYSTLQQLNT